VTIIKPKKSSDASFSVLLAYCEKDEPKKLGSAIRSVSVSQKLQPDKIILVRDGCVGFKLDETVKYWKRQLGEKVISLKLKENVGLACALNFGLQHCNTKYVARMDSDDISLPNRFESQINYLRDNPMISVVGCHAIEVDEVGNKSIKNLPTRYEDIKKYAKTRNPLNHPSVLFNREHIIAVAGYPLLRNGQDYALWCTLLQYGYKISNLETCSIELSAGEGLAKRRGWSYLKLEILMFNHIRSIGFLSIKEMCVNIAIRGLLRVPPASIRSFIYKITRQQKLD